MDAGTEPLRSGAFALTVRADGLLLTYAGRSLLGAFSLAWELEDAAGAVQILRAEALTPCSLPSPRSVGDDRNLELWLHAAQRPGLQVGVTLALRADGLYVTPHFVIGTECAGIRLRAFIWTATPSADSAFSGIGRAPGFRVFLTGYNSFSPSLSRDSREIFRTPRFPTAGAFNQHAESIYWDRPEVLSSPWMAALTRTAPLPGGESAPQVLLGFLSARVGLGEVALIRNREPRRVELQARLGLGGCIPAPGTQLDGDTLWIGASPDGEALVRAWTDRCAESLPRRPLPAATPSGWCSWYYFYTAVTQQDVADNLDGLDRARRRLPVQYVQLDDGYQTKIGEWLSVNRKFPGGLSALARRIRDAGFVPGIWTAPFLVQRSSLIYKAHPDWLLRGKDGKLRRIGYHPFWGVLDGQVYALDPTHPEVADWLRCVFASLVEWGFDYFKIDFLFAGLREGLHHDRAATPVAAYRRGIELIRAAIGDRFLLGCGAPLLPSVGFFDGMRISSDVKERWRDRPVELLTGESGHPAAELAILNCLTRAHLHDVLWKNDPDCLLVRADRSALTRAEVQTLVSVLSLTGGMLFLSDDLRTLSPDRRALAELALPPAGAPARALGLLTESRPERFVRTQELSDGTFETLAALLNWSDETREREVTPERFGLPTGAYHVHELWSRRTLRLAARESARFSQAPHGTLLLLFRPQAVPPRPQIVTVTHHLGQTTVLLKEEVWDAASGVLRVVLESGADREGEVIWADAPGWSLREASAPQASELGVPAPSRGGARLRIGLLAGQRVELLLRFDRTPAPGQ